MEAQYPINLEITSPQARVSYIHATFGDAYRVTLAYRLVGIEQPSPERDPCFVIHVGLSFCNLSQGDKFSRREGRESPKFGARGRMETQPLIVRVYLNSDVLESTLRTLAKLSYREWRLYHVPDVFAKVFRRTFRKVRPVVVNENRKAYRAKRSAAARAAYNAAIRAGKSEEQAISEARTAIVEIDR